MSQIAPGHPCLAARRRQQRREHLDQRRFACSIRSDQAENFPITNTKIDVIDNGMPIERFRQTSRLDLKILFGCDGHGTDACI
ncbi:MAG: hypothetical protein NVV83_18800 [Afipia sp.]|nr:hypothetical protein [Afipia sp.]